MTWQTTPEEFPLAVEEADTVLRGNGISQTQRTHVRRVLESVYAEYGEAFGSVPFCLACKKQAKRVFVLLHLQCDSHSPRCTGEDQGNGVSAPCWPIWGRTGGSSGARSSSGS